MTIAEVVALATGLTGLGGGLLAWLRAGRDAPKIRADAIEIIQDQRDECLKREAEIIQRAEALEKSLREARHELDELRERIRHLEVVMPFCLEAEAAAEDLRAVMEAASEPWGLSSASDGGQITYANSAFCHAVGLPLERLLALPWGELLHPDDLSRMRATEGRAWSAESARGGHPGRYKVFGTAGELVGYRQLRFFFSRYGTRGTTRWLARDEGMVA